ncbi:MAG: diadenylate cyclase CdaA [Candidatus Sumerlaeia bacterium]|nr:diadenylate cyclase CdaA [Candidatus Sumerlaeia bacterium]
MDDLFPTLGALTWSDAIDILLVSFAFFLLLSVIRESRSPLALRGLVISTLGGFLLYTVAQQLGLSATVRLFENLWIVLILVFLICFQNEIKRGLTDLGRRPLFRSFFAQRTTAIEDIIVAATRLAEKKTGALIAIQRDDSLRSYAETGTELDAAVSVELLRTIFALYTPLHDGAVIIRNNRVFAAGCLLPLSESTSIPKDLGTRHRAALGLAEETDAVVLVCSEETGVISLARDGRIERPETAESLRSKLKALFDLDEEDDDGEAGR